MRLVLMLLRHGEAQEAAVASRDHDRVLTARGRQLAGAAGRLIATQLERPTLALVSDAARTKETWTAAQPVLADCASEYRPAIYSAESVELGELLASIDTVLHQAVLLIGHNPGLSDLASELSGRYQRFSPAEGVILSVEAATWAEATAQTNWAIVTQLRPTL